jgi:Ni,Fe-hydrogenase I cytochrome b subunit
MNGNLSSFHFAGLRLASTGAYLKTSFFSEIGESEKSTSILNYSLKQFGRFVHSEDGFLAIFSVAVIFSLLLRLKL